MFLFVFPFFLFLFFVLFLILGAHSLAGGRREYGRSGREPLYYIFILYVGNTFFIHFVWLINICCLVRVRYFIRLRCCHTHLVCKKHLNVFMCFSLNTMNLMVMVHDNMFKVTIKPNNKNKTCWLLSDMLALC